MRTDIFFPAGQADEFPQVPFRKLSAPPTPHQQRID